MRLLNVLSLIALISLVVSKIEKKSRISSNIDRMIETATWNMIDKEMIEIIENNSNKKLGEILKVPTEEWEKSSEIIKYEDISKKNLIPFIENLSAVIKLDGKYLQLLQNELINALFVEDESFIEIQMVFSVSNKDCKYFHLMVEINEDNTFDFLAVDVKTVFTLDENIFWKQSTVGGWYTLTHTGILDSEIIFGKDVLLKEEIDYLLEFFEFVVSQKFKNSKL